MADEIKHYANCEGGEDCECEYTAWLEAEPAVPKRIAEGPMPGLTRRFPMIRLAEERARVEAAIPQSMQWERALEAAAVPSGADFIVDALASMPPLLAFAEQMLAEAHRCRVSGALGGGFILVDEVERIARECGISIGDDDESR